MKLLIVSGILLLFTYAQAASLSGVLKAEVAEKLENLAEKSNGPEVKNLSSELEKSVKSDELLSEINRHRRNVRIGGLGGGLGALGSLLGLGGGYSNGGYNNGYGGGYNNGGYGNGYNNGYGGYGNGGYGNGGYNNGYNNGYGNGGYGNGGYGKI